MSTIIIITPPPPPPTKPQRHGRSDDDQTIRIVLEGDGSVGDLLREAADAADRMDV